MRSWRSVKPRSRAERLRISARWMARLRAILAGRKEAQRAAEQLRLWKESA